MPIKIPDKLPATAQLRKENIFVMSEKKAMHQDIRPLKIVIVNLMPTKIATETQLLRLLSNSPLQIEIDFLQMDTHESKNTPSEHLATFYTTFDEIKDSKYDGMIITGAPVENLEYEDVDYWGELTRIMDWSKTHVTSTCRSLLSLRCAEASVKRKMFGSFQAQGEQTHGKACTRF